MSFAGAAAASEDVMNDLKRAGIRRNPLKEYAPYLAHAMRTFFGFEMGTMEHIPTVVQILMPLMFMVVPFAFYGFTSTLVGAINMAVGILACIGAVFLWVVFPSMSLTVRFLRPVLLEIFRPEKVLPRSLRKFPEAIRNIDRMQIIGSAITSSGCIMALLYNMYYLIIREQNYEAGVNVLTFIFGVALIFGFHLCVTMASTWSLVCVLHEAELELLVLCWKQRSRHPLLETQLPQPLTLLDCLMLRLRLLGSQHMEGEFLGRAAPFLIQSGESLGGGLVSIDVIISSFHATRDSLEWSSSMVGSVVSIIVLFIFPLAAILQGVCLFTLGSAYISTAAFPILYPLVFMAIIPALRVNLRWAAASEAMRAALSLYSETEQLRLLNIMTQYPMRFSMAGFTMTPMVFGIMLTPPIMGSLACIIFVLAPSLTVT